MITHDPLTCDNKKAALDGSKLTVCLYDFDHRVRKEVLDLDSSRGRFKLRHILTHESFRLKSKDLQFLEKTQKEFRSKKQRPEKPIFHIGA